jgi:C1A family cysteine protease
MYKMGYLRALADKRDYCFYKQPEAATLNFLKQDWDKLEARAPEDLSKYFTFVEDQMNLGSCTANAAVGIFEYFMNRKDGHATNLSRLFLYKVTRQLMGGHYASQDSGAYIRTTMGALATIGTCAEQQYPYTDGKGWNKEPAAFCYAMAGANRIRKYSRLDVGLSPADIVKSAKLAIAGGFPVNIGFTVYNFGNNGEFYYPGPNDPVLGGHAIVLVYYDDSKVIKNPNTGKTTTGAFKLRNSWGPGWGQNGYGWLPYQYVLSAQADDFWTLQDADFVDSDAFGFNR